MKKCYVCNERMGEYEVRDSKKPKGIIVSVCSADKKYIERTRDQRLVLWGVLAVICCWTIFVPLIFVIKVFKRLSALYLRKNDYAKLSQ
ncbi:hypothetical protein [Spiroplasma endosymbiont of Crioceris asparagi]|uniref:hypothetical protein n=1 Tax=Spiroplasma endosymbiont of Crioceris asparagi TaxID=3066286 RepID=UPI0030D00F3F